MEADPTNGALVGSFRGQATILRGAMGPIPNDVQRFTGIGTSLVIITVNGMLRSWHLAGIL